MSTAQFYDGLTDTYHALYPDWQDATRTQAEALHGLLRRWHQGPVDVVDVACGIGTQLIGLARLGHRLTGLGISVRAVQRGRRGGGGADVRARPGLGTGCPAWISASGRFSGPGGSAMRPTSASGSWWPTCGTCRWRTPVPT